MSEGKSKDRWLDMGIGRNQLYWLKEHYCYFYSHRFPITRYLQLISGHLPFQRVREDMRELVFTDSALGEFGKRRS